MKEWMAFLAGIAEPLVELFKYVTNAAKTGQTDPEQEKQLAMRLVRQASDEAMRRELGG